MTSNINSGEPLKILVEDNPAHAEMVIRSFKDNRIVNEISHEEALDFLQSRGYYTDNTIYPRPHLVLLDLRLPMWMACRF